MSQPSAPTSSAPATSSSPSPQASAPKDSSASSQPPKSSPSVSGSSSDAGGVPTVESVTGGSVKSEQSAKAPEQKPNETAGEKAERKAEEARIKAKVNGKEREYTLEEARRRLELIDGAEEKFQTAAQMRKQVEQFIETLRKDPKKILLNPELGINFREIAEEYLGAEVRKEMMDPQQRELEELRAWKAEQDAKAKEEQESRAKTEEQQRFEAAKKQKIQEYDQKIAKVLGETNLPKTPYTVKRVAEVLHSAMKKGYELDAATAADFVRESYMSDIQAMFGGLEGEQLLNVLGDGLAKKIRKYDLDQLKAKLNPPPPVSLNSAAPEQPAQPSAPSSSKKQQFLSEAEWKEMIRKKAGV